MRSLFVLLPVVFFVSCATKNAKIPNELVQAGKSVPVTDWQYSILNKDPIVVGPFKTEQLDIGTGVQTGKSVSIGGFGGGKSSKSQSFSFNMTKGGSSTKVKVSCTKVDNASSTKIAGFGSKKKSQTLTCEGDAGKFTFTGDQSVIEGAKISGKIAVSPINQDIEGGESSDNLGFTLSNQSNFMSAINFGPKLDYTYLPSKNDDDLHYASIATAFFISHRLDKVMGPSL